LNYRKIAVWILILLAIALAAGALHFVDRKPWMGLSSDVKPIGKFRNVEACRIEVGKIGGWCGKDCKNYGAGMIADCAPLTKVERVE
jgi:hypothetical protein